MQRSGLLFKIFFTLLTIWGEAAPIQSQPLPEYQAKDFSHLYGMQGFTDDLLKIHFTLYNGYVKNTNLLIQLLNNYIATNQDRDYTYQALKRRFGWEFDGMRLHEYYFGNLGGKKPLDQNSALYKMIVRDFGSFDNWKADFIATGLLRGIGWSILYFDPQADRLFNVWINEHDLGHLAGGDLILAMDVWEHAYMPQYGTDRAKYIGAFFENILWEVAVSRFHNAIIRR